MKIIFALLLICLSINVIFSQQADRCGTEESERIRALKNAKVERKDIFEKWLSNKINSAKFKSTVSKTGEVTYTIPVVVHVIHRGEAIGSGSNISDERIYSQIKVLNEDYSRTNADAAKTRNVFKSVAANCNIQFQLAVTDPDGFSTTGINRVKSTRTSWDYESNSKLKSLSYWNSAQYLNIWVCNLSDGLLGYAQYPQSDLSGLTASDLGADTYKDTKNASTDGVVIVYNAFGSYSSKSYPYNTGRTTTHEIGHYLGLRHTWGDVSDCGGTDFCDDTPNLNGSSSGCSTSKQSCDNKTQAMVENYLDYSYDTCMNVFTLDQKTRMRTVLENSPRRKSLWVSPGLSTPNLTADDAGIKAIISNNKYCQGTVDIRIVLKNFGNNNLFKTDIYYSIDNVAPSKYSWTGNLASAGNDTITLTTSNLAFGDHSLSVNTFLPNGGSDSKTRNDSLTSFFSVKKVQSVPFKVDFNDGVFPPKEWELSNPDLETTWKDTLASGSISKNNLSAYINLYDYDDSSEEQDALYSPSYDFSKTTTATLLFNYAYAQIVQRQYTSNDGLIVLASTDCGNTFDITLFEKYGSDLSTTNSDNSAFRPKHLSDWNNESIDLSQFLGKPNVSFAFISVNDYGNNLYLDDIQTVLVTGTEIEQQNPGLVTISPNPNDGNFSIDLSLPENQDITLQLSDALGKLVHEDSYKNVSRYNILYKSSSLAPGMYYVNVKGKNFQKVSKIIVY